MKRYLLLGFVCMLSGFTLSAKEDPVLMRINGHEVSRSEFEYGYRQYCATAAVKVTPKDYAELFIIKKLKVAAARTAGLDTVPAFRKQQEAFKTALLKSYLVDEQVTDSYARALYSKRKSNQRNGQVQIMQIFRYLPQTVTSRRLEGDKTRMDSIYSVVKNQSDKEFTRTMEQLSDDKTCRWIESRQTTSEFEEIAFSLAKGEVSQPFFTPAGIHILKVVDRRETPSYEAVREQLSGQMQKMQRLDKGIEAVIERMKKDFGYTPNAAGMEELLTKGETSQTLFTLDGKAYTGELFKRFASSHPQSTKRQLDGFVTKSLMDYESRNIENKHPEVGKTLLENEENVLMAQLTRQKLDLPVANDRAGLATYFKFHQQDYRWEKPRYKGVVLHCADKKTSKLAKKRVKKLPVKEWADTLRRTFNTSTVEKIKVEQGIFAEGDNKYVDKLVFKKGGFELDLSYPFIVVVGKKVKGPDDYREVLEQVRKDYRNYLDVCWTQELRTKSKVEINQEVLKTVNND